MRAFSRARSTAGKSVRSTAAYDALFDAYKEADAETMGPEGVERLCSDMAVDPSDVSLLVLAWTMGAARMGYLTREEWAAGAPQLGGSTSAPSLLVELRALHQAREVARPARRRIWLGSSTGGDAHLRHTELRARPPDPAATRQATRPTPPRRPTDATARHRAVPRAARLHAPLLPRGATENDRGGGGGGDARAAAQAALPRTLCLALGVPVGAREAGAHPSPLHPTPLHLTPPTLHAPSHSLPYILAPLSRPSTPRPPTPRPPTQRPPTPPPRGRSATPWLRPPPTTNHKSQLASYNSHKSQLTHHKSQVTVCPQRARGILMDEWLMLLQFCREVKPDCSNYADDGAWYDIVYALM